MISTSFRAALSAFLFAGALGLSSTGPVQAQSVMKQCGDDWKAAKTNNTTNGLTWPEFLKQCRVQKEGAAAPAATPAAASAPAPAPAPIAPAPTYQPKPKPMQAARATGAGEFSSEAQAKARCPATRWSGSTPRASPTPIIIRVRVGTARLNRGLTCARPTPEPQGITRRRAKRNSRSRCSHRGGRAARKLRGRPCSRRVCRPLTFG